MSTIASQDSAKFQISGGTKLAPSKSVQKTAQRLFPTKKLQNLHGLQQSLNKFMSSFSDEPILAVVEAKQNQFADSSKFLFSMTLSRFEVQSVETYNILASQ